MEITNVSVMPLKNGKFDCLAICQFTIDNAQNNIKEWTKLQNEKNLLGWTPPKNKKNKRYEDNSEEN
jgi:hypothetical protein